MVPIRQHVPLTYVVDNQLRQSVQLPVPKKLESQLSDKFRTYNHSFLMLSAHQDAGTSHSYPANRKHCTKLLDLLLVGLQKMVHVHQSSYFHVVTRCTKSRNPSLPEHYQIPYWFLLSILRSKLDTGWQILWRLLCKSQSASCHGQWHQPLLYSCAEFLKFLPQPFAVSGWLAVS